MKEKSKAAPAVMIPHSITFTARGAPRDRVDRLDSLAGARRLSRWEYVDRLIHLHEALLMATREDKKHHAYQVMVELGLGPVEA